MKRNLLIFLFVIGFLICIVIASAVDFTPQGDIDLRGTYAIKNATNITAQYYCNATTCYTLSEIYSDGTVEEDLNVNSSVYAENWTTDAGNLDSINETQMENSGGYLNILVSWLTSLFYEKSEVYNKTEAYNKTEVYNKSETYTKSETDNNLSNYILSSEEGNLNTNSTTWWATVSGFISKWFYKLGNDLALNETLLNLSIDARETNCTDDGSCPLITYDSELAYTTDTSAYVNCSTDEVFLGNGSCRSSNAFFDDTDTVDGNASSICSTDEVLLGNGTCWSAANFFDDTTIADTNASTECSGDEVLLGNTTCWSAATFFDDTDTVDGNASSICSGTTTYLDGEGNCDDISGVYIDESDEGNLNVNSSLSLNTSVGFIKDVNGTQMEENSGILNILVSWLTGLFYTKAEVDTNFSLYIPDSDLPLANKTLPYCGNITGPDADFCVDADTTYTNGSAISLVGTEINLTTCGDNEIWKMDGSAWNCEADDAGAGAFEFNITGDSGTQETIDTTNVVSILGGTNGIDTVVGATDKITINVDISEMDTATPSDGDTTHLSTADHIYDWVIGLSYLVAGDIVGLVGNWSADKDDYSTTAEADALYRADDWDNFTGIPTATPSDGDTTHFSLADEIYDWVIGLSYLVAGDIVGLVGNWSADKADYWDATGDLDNVIATDEITELKIDFNTACAAGSHLYVSGNNLACETDDDTTYTAGSNLDLTSTVFSLEENVNITSLNVSEHFRIDTANITCLDTACNWFTNATDSCMYWPSGGKDCGAA